MHRDLPCVWAEQQPKQHSLCVNHESFRGEGKGDLLFSFSKFCPFQYIALNDLIMSTQNLYTDRKAIIFLKTEKIQIYDHQ